MDNILILWISVDILVRYPFRISISDRYPWFRISSSEGPELIRIIQTYPDLSDLSDLSSASKFPDVKVAKLLQSSLYFCFIILHHFMNNRLLQILIIFCNMGLQCTGIHKIRNNANTWASHCKVKNLGRMPWPLSCHFIALLIYSVAWDVCVDWEWPRVTTIPTLLASMVQLTNLCCIHTNYYWI